MSGTTLAAFAVGILVGLAAAALTFAVARRRAYLDDALAKVYGPLHMLLSENAYAWLKVRELEKRLMENYSSETAPFSTAEKKAAAEAFLGVEARIVEAVINANRERMKEAVASWGHLLDDDDYLALADEVARASAARAVAESDLPKVMRDAPRTGESEGAVLEQIRDKFLALAGERRAGFFPAVVAGVRHLFSAR